MKYLAVARLLSRKFAIIVRVLKLMWQVRPWAIINYAAGALLETGSYICSLFATAKLGSLLAHYLADGDSHQIWLWLWVDIAAAVGVGLGFWLMDWSKRLLYFQIVQWSTREFQASLCRLDIADFYDEIIRNRVNKAQSGYTWQMSNFSENVLDLGYGVLRFVATASIATQIAWWLIPLIVLFLMPSLVAQGWMAKVQWFVWDSKGDERHIFWRLDWLIRQPKNQMELRSSQARQYALNKIDQMNRSFYRRQEHEYQRVNRLALPAKLIEVGGTVVGSVLALRQFLAGSISLDRYFFLSGALLRIGGTLNNIFRTLGRMHEISLFVENYFGVIDHLPRFVDQPHAKPLITSSPPEIVFEHVSFTYPGQESAIFEDLSLTIAPGEHVALVGGNGAGKSTLIKLLLRFYQPDSGRILLNGQDLRELTIESWYEQLATLFQDFNQYPFSIAENIEVARPKFRGDLTRLQMAARMSSVDQFVHTYDHGWETVLDNSFSNGVEPSGGQWQRVALARAFYRQAAVLILDEPTAAIDAKAEYDIFNNIFDQHCGKTAIIVSHRFSTVRRAGTIVVIDQGKIIEKGSHQTLMRRTGLYHELFTKQAEGYRD